MPQDERTVKDLEAAARAWLEADPDPVTREELARILAAGDTVALAERFQHPLVFGTAGLRGPLGAGPSRMNIAVVGHFSSGLARYLAAGTGRVGTVVVGHDARNRSADFAAAAAQTMAYRGARVLLLDQPLPTPLTAFAVRHFRASAGVMVTASHNPAPDNGYKVYLSDGAQVFPPHDAEIALAAEAAQTVPARSAAEHVPTGGNMASSGHVEPVDIRTLIDDYAGAVLGLVRRDGPRDLQVVYTPVHGVGGAVVPDLLVRAGFGRPWMVPEQADPDPEFLTAPLPNPEEPGVLDLAIALARERGADIVFANDPDADRLAVAVPVPTGPGRSGPTPLRPAATSSSGVGGWHIFTGDELGTLIGDHLLNSVAGEVAIGKVRPHTTPVAGLRVSGLRPLVATSIVSSTFLAKLAAAAGVAHVETLTGFKWLARAGAGHPGHRLVFAYEEALGYACSEAVADKDGMSAALVVAEMAALAKAEGRSLLDRLDELESAHGVHTTSQWSGRIAGSGALQRLGAIMDRLRESPPLAIAGTSVLAFEDLLAGARPDLPASDVLIYHLDNGSRVVLRPSGTEPKLKVYFQVTTAPCPRSELSSARATARALTEQLHTGVANLVQIP
ncbi:MAG TPA: phospho-sugar mutase [Acidimicrobiales bacterium]|nr:phospho-sugar mutase [Acidimicrobiales bacterium]